MSQPLFKETPVTNPKAEDTLSPETIQAFNLALAKKTTKDLIEGVDKTNPYTIEITGPLQNSNIGFALKVNGEIAFLGNFPQFALADRKEYLANWLRLNKLTADSKLKAEQLEQIFVFAPEHINDIELQAFQDGMKKSLAISQVPNELFMYNTYKGAETSVIVDPTKKRFLIAELELQHSDPEQAQIKLKKNSQILTQNY